MATNGFDISELSKLEKKMLAMANEELPKESKKHLKKEAGNLSKVQKKELKSKGIGTEKRIENEILKKMKSGKVYKFDGNFSCRAYAGHPLAHLLNNGFIHKGGRNKNGEETFVPGYHFIEGAENEFQEQYYTDTEAFLMNVVGKLL